MKKETIFKKYKWFALSVPYFDDNMLKPYALFRGNIVFLAEQEKEFKDREPTVVTAENYEEVVNKIADMFIGYAKDRGGDNNDLIMGLLIGMTSPYRLQFLQFIKEDISAQELGKALAWVWTETEFPNSNGIEALLRLFKLADRRSLMDDDEWEILEKLPEEVAVFRGTQSKKAKVRGMSWTLDRKKAEWFRDRFKKLDGKVYEASIKKEEILAYFSGRNESEVIVNPKKLKEVKEVSE